MPDPAHREAQRHRAERRPRAGPAAGRGALVLVALLALAAAALVLVLARGRRAERPRGSRASEETAAASEPDAPARAPLTEPAPSERAEVRPAPEPEAEAAAPGIARLTVLVLAPQPGEDGEPAPEFDGRARVRVRHASGGFDSTLELGPADPRAELDCPAGEVELTLQHAGTERLGALPIRTVVEAGADELVTLALVRVLELRGRVDGPLGAAADVPLALERRGRVSAVTRSRADGGFAFEPLPVGDYALVVGDPLAPLVPSRTLQPAAWTRELSVRLPELFELEVRVLDAEGRAVARASVEGVGSNGGRVSGETDRAGALRAARLPAGSYRLSAGHDELGRGWAVVEIAREAPGAAEIRLER